MVLLLSILWTIFFQVNDQKLEYEIYYHDANIGSYVVERSESDGLIRYKSKSITKIHFMATVSVELTQNVHYKEGVMIWSEAITKVNGSEHSQVSLKKTGNSYQLKSGSKISTIHDEIHHSMVSLMFEEPVNLGRVFSEVEGEFHRIEWKSANNYIKTNSKGRKNYYLFDAKGMKHADVDAGYYRFEMRRKD